MRYASRIPLITLLACTAASSVFAQGRGVGGGSPHAREEMPDGVFVEFDRVYIPTLALTNQNKPSANQALSRLSMSWDARFVDRFHEMFQGDSAWAGDIGHIAECIALAEAELKSGEPLKAHEALEPIRDILTEARRRNNVEYPLDSLTRFHATMEDIVKPAMELTPDSLDQAKIGRFTELGEQAEQQWQLVEKTRFDLAAFGKNEQQQKQFLSMLQAERESIRRLNDVLTTHNKEAIIKAAREIKPPFANVYMFFGDFPQPTENTR